MKKKKKKLKIFRSIFIFVEIFKEYYYCLGVEKIPK